MLYLTTALAALSLTLTVNHDFELWKKEHGKSYKNVQEEAEALKAYEENDAIIRAHNAKNLSYTLGHNEWSDMTWEKFQNTVMGELYLNVPPKNTQRVHIKLKEAKIADSVDWVTAGAVTPVKNQGHCGSCWSFSTTGSVEGAYQIATGTLKSFSEEELVECDTSKDHGCRGGLMDNAFEFIKTNGLTTESNYPYTAAGGVPGSRTCQTTKEAQKEVILTGHTDVPQGDEDALKSAASQQPVSIAIEADKSAFQMYKSGVLDSASCGQRLDHGVLLVGYGNDAASGKDYWKVKNSWGTTWGEEGYVRMVRGKNMCGIAQSASYPTGVKAASPSPPTPPSPPSPPTPPGSQTHYSDPKNGCLPDEQEATVTGISGDMCISKCSLFKACPTDVPVGVTANPQCALQDQSSHQKYCALICSPTLPIFDQKVADAQCGTNASCKPAGMGMGICTYDD